MKKPAVATAIFFALIVLSFPKNLEKRIYTAEHINPHFPVIDGKLDDEIWKKREWESQFTQREPYEGKDPSQKTAFKIYYDDNNIYIAIKAYDSELEKIERRLGRRDEIDGDWVNVEIDSYYDQRTAFSFTVNAAGVKADRLISNNGDNVDPNWDPIWYVKTSTDELGWNAEMRIPLSQLRYGNKSEQVWGLQLTRQLFRKEETSHWQFIPKESSGWVSQFGTLKGIQGIKSQRQVELRPYTVGKTQHFQKISGNPFATGQIQDLVGGLDGKIGLTSDLTLDFTINPDFGQVEADPSEVNLTAFETYFEEKRPFFIEGKNILNFRLMLGDGDLSSDNLFYSRRIGGRPHYTPSLNSNEYLDMPNNTSILGAFKLTGKTKNGISIGIIDGITASEQAAISYLGKIRQQTVEPMTNFFGLRLQKDYNQGNTMVGSMLTATNRNLQETHLNFLHSDAYTGGIDFDHWWKNRSYYFHFNSVFSHVRGSPDAIMRTQLSPLRYFQRSDAKHVELDPKRTSLSGYGGSAYFGKLGNGHLNFLIGSTWRSPGLELNDMGYLRDADNILEFIWGSYRIWEPFAAFRTFNINFNQWMGWNFGGEQTYSGGNISFNGQFKNYYNFSLGLNRNNEGLTKSILRGGPSLKWPGRWGGWINLQSDSRKKLRFNIGYNLGRNDASNSFFNSYNTGLIFIPNKALSFSIFPTYSINDQNLQYVGTEILGSDERYIFARINQKTLALTIRLNLCLSPDLTIQFYGQPFISSGKYNEFKRILDSRADEYSQRFLAFSEHEINFVSESETYTVDENNDGIMDYSFNNPNFNFLQFRSNLVVRWEYKPGSSLFLVWSQGRTGFQPSSDFSFGQGMQDLFNVYPHNVFLIKFSYCFQL